MSLYRVMVSGKQDYWETMEVEADTKEQAIQKALQKAGLQSELDWAHSTGVQDIHVEAVEVLEEDVPKSSDHLWLEDIFSREEEN